MAPRSQKAASAAPAGIVRLVCTQCNTRLGTFPNEWIRLTSTYARPKQRGNHTMTEIGNRVQHVPVGVSQKAAEGCGMSEVFCRLCSSLVGQYCKTVPDRKRQELVDKYFYKFSKTHLIDVTTLTRVEPVFTYADDPTSAATSTTTPPVSSARPKPISSIRAHPGSADSQSRSQVRSSGASAPEPVSPVQRTRVLERESGSVSQSGSSMERSVSRQRWGEDSIRDQQKQITSLSKQIDSLKSTMHDLSTLVHKLYAERQDAGGKTSCPAHPTAENTPLLNDSDAQSSELERLRRENEQLRQRFEMIESVMGVKHGTAGSRPIHGLSPEEQLLTPGVSQQSSLEMKSREFISSYPAESETPQNDGDPSQLTDVTRDSVAHDDDYHPGEETEVQPGSETAGAEAYSDRRALNSPTPESPVPNEDQTLKIANRSSSALSLDDSQPTVVPTPNPVGVSSESQARAKRQGSKLSQSQPKLNYLPGQALFGVMKPVRQKPQEKQAANGQGSPAMNSPELSGPRRYPVAVPRLDEADLVEFSDDENPGSSKGAVMDESEAEKQLHYGASLSGPPRAPGISPWVPRDPITVDPPITSVPWDLNSSSQPTNPGPGSADLKIHITVPEQVRDCLEKGETLFRGPKGAKEKRPPMQTTEKLLNEELMELGLEEWIGKDKNSKEYRELIAKARAEKRERKKQEALAKAGVICVNDPALSQSPPAVEESEATGKKPGRSSKKAATLRKNKRTKQHATPWTEMTDGQDTDQPGPNSSKRKAAALAHSHDDEAGADEEPPETGRPRRKRVSSRKTSNINEPVKTRRQTRASAIDASESREQEEAEGAETEI